MEFDPSARDGPPPRYAIESDSEESDDERALARPAESAKPPFKSPAIAVRSSDKTDSNLMPGKPLVVLVNASGEAFIRTVGSGGQDPSNLSEHAGLFADDEQQGALYHGQSGSGSVALLRPSTRFGSQQATFAYLSATLLSAVKPSRVLVVDGYFPSLYLSDTGEVLEAPVRWLQSSKPAVQPAASYGFEAPNYVTGLGAALMAEASISGTPATLALVPQEHSANPHLQALQRAQSESSSPNARPEPLSDRLCHQLSPVVASLVDHRTTKAEAARSLDSFLRDRRSRERKRYQQDISAMYM